LLTILADNLQQLYRELREGERLGRLVAEALFVDMLRQLTAFYAEDPAQGYVRFVQPYPDLQQLLHRLLYWGQAAVSLSQIRSRAAS
jgi:hypothetical protein